MFESKFLVLHKNLNFPVVPLVVILCHCIKVGIFHFFLFFHTPLTFSFFLYTHSFFFNTHTFFTQRKTQAKGEAKIFFTCISRRASGVRKARAHSIGARRKAPGFRSFIFSSKGFIKKRQNKLSK